MKWSATAPANIALIKYMGKKAGTQNIPLNASLSYTLPALLTYVTIEKHNIDKDTWAPLSLDKNTTPHVFSEKAQTRFLDHFRLIKQQFGCKDNFVVRSANNFPHAAGLASSASSFAALTKAACLAAAACTNQPVPAIEDQANLSRIGSGSSCRSFFEPWAFWDNTTVKAITLPYPKLIHQIIIIETTEKKISSSEAHRRVASLSQYPERQKRVEKNLNALLHAFEKKAWDEAYHICWQEFEDMHALFEASTPAFRYMTEKTVRALNILKHDWHQKGDGPLVTMDAGPNIHLLYRPDQKDLAETFRQKAMEQSYHVL